MGWSNMEEQHVKKGMSTSSMVLLAIIACVILMIILICVLLMTSEQKTTSPVTVDGKAVTVNEKTLFAKESDTTYVNIEEFSKIVGYEYHKGEYNGYTNEEGKCYVKGKIETTTFFLDDTRVCKLPVDEMGSEYREFIIEKPIKKINEKMYIPIDSVSLAFNVYVKMDSKSLTVMTLDYLVKLYDKQIKNWGYTGIADQTFENQKTMLYGCFIVKKEGGLYKVINANNEEIISDKYTSIEFDELTKEFFVTNNLGQVGIINVDGTPKIEPVYDSMSILDEKSDLYLIQKDKKYGVVKSGNVTIISPEYDKIGLDTEMLSLNNNNQYFILDTLIPVFKDNKWGAFDREGNQIYKMEYDGFGCNSTKIEINGITKAVSPVLTIKRCNGVVVEKNQKYGLIDITGKELVPVAVNSIYAASGVENEDMKYFMAYNGGEINIIKRLIEVKLIEGPFNDSTGEEHQTNNESSNILENTTNSNTIQTSSGISNSITITNSTNNVN